MHLKNKKILVTGADGLIGSYLIETLSEERCLIKAFAYYNSFNSWGWLDTFPEEKLEVFTGDIRDPNCMRTATNDVDMVFHPAALIGIPFSYHSSGSYTDTNINARLIFCRHAEIANIE